MKKYLITAISALLLSSACSNQQATDETEAKVETSSHETKAESASDEIKASEPSSQDSTQAEQEDSTQTPDTSPSNSDTESGEQAVTYHSTYDLLTEDRIRGAYMATRQVPQAMLELLSGMNGPEIPVEMISSKLADRLKTAGDFNNIVLTLNVKLDEMDSEDASEIASRFSGELNTISIAKDEVQGESPYYWIINDFQGGPIIYDIYDPSSASFLSDGY